MDLCFLGFLTSCFRNDGLCNILLLSLVEMFLIRIRYTSMSLPYHIGNGIFGGLLPAVATYLVTSAKDTGNPVKLTRFMVSNYRSGSEFNHWGNLH